MIGLMRRGALPAPEPEDLPDSPALAYVKRVSRMAAVAAAADRFVLCECQNEDREGGQEVYRRGFFPLVSSQCGPPVVVGLVCECCAEVVLLNNGRLVAP